LMLPVLEYLSSGKEHTTKDLREAMATEFKITAKERKQLLPSGRKLVFDSRVGWADFFEDLVVKLLVAMGYGGSLADAGQRVGGTGDGGIDVIIKEDKLGLSQIYIQAKRWGKPVGSPEIQQFAGALTAKNAEKGAFITTSRFIASAISFAEKVPKNIVLIDGGDLAERMIDYNIGVSEEERYIVKRIDSDFFEQCFLRKKQVGRLKGVWK
jgi:restriction endonuclease Mrr